MRTEKEKRREVRGSAVNGPAAKKKLEEMNLLDDFLFGSVVTYPEIGEQFVRILLKTVFGREIKHLSVAAQKVFYGADSDMHGTRLDVYMEADIEENAEERATVYDMEPDQKSSEADRKILPRRVRFYHAKIAARSLQAGLDYDKLKNVVIIMILPFDPFGWNRMRYTVKNRCLEVPGMEYEDGASTLFLYTKGTEGELAEELKQLLCYMENTTYENAVNEDLRKIHGMVETVKRDPEVTVKYMRLWEEFERRLAEGEAIGIEKGMAKGEAIGIEKGMAKGEAIGIERGIEKGIEKGIAKGEAAGDLQRLVSQICKKMKKNKTVEEIAEELEEEVSVVEKICHVAEKFAPEFDIREIAKEISERNDAEIR